MCPCRCGAAEGCAYPGALRDLYGRTSVPSRACDLKLHPAMVSGTTPVAPELSRNADVAAWTSGDAHGFFERSVDSGPLWSRAVSLCQFVVLLFMLYSTCRHWMLLHSLRTAHHLTWLLTRADQVAPFHFFHLTQKLNSATWHCVQASQWTAVQSWTGTA